MEGLGQEERTLGEGNDAKVPRLSLGVCRGEEGITEIVARLASVKPCPLVDPLRRMLRVGLPLDWQ